MTTAVPSKHDLDARFPNNGKFTAWAAPTGTIERSRRGEDCANIPWILPGNTNPFNNLVKTRRENAFDLEKEEDRREYRKRLEASARDPQAQEELASYRSFVITNDIMATPFALGAFQVVDLSPDELPLIERPQSRNFVRFTVRSQSIDGGSRQAQWRTTKDVATYEMDSIATDRVNYPLIDIQQGDISQSEAINRELAYDMEMKIDGLAKTNIDALQTASGLRALMSFHPSVVQANVPDGNYYDLNAVYAGNNDVLTIEKMKHILNHIALLQSVGGPLAGLSISTIMLSPQNMRDSWDFIDLVSGVAGNEPVLPAKTVTTPVREQIFSSGMFTSAWGYTWSWTPNQQIPKGRMYVFMNKPVGWMFTKQSMDQVFQWNATNSPDHAESNMGEIMMRRVLTFIAPDVWKYHILIIDL